jgi:hypothetical protein
LIPGNKKESLPFGSSFLFFSLSFFSFLSTHAHDEGLAIRNSANVNSHTSDQTLHSKVMKGWMKLCG